MVMMNDASKTGHADKVRALPSPNDAVTDPSRKQSHLHEWQPAPDPGGNRAERRAAAKKTRRR